MVFFDYIYNFKDKNMNTTLVINYINENWERSIYHDKPGCGFGGVDLPYSYTSPCIKGEGYYSFFFYWDTYFTNLGLLRQGRIEIARDNIRNILWLIKRQGYMPNHVGIYNRSQSPYLCRMVKEYMAATGEKDFLTECAEGLRQEYHFWTTARNSPIGLNSYGHHDTWKGCEIFYDKCLVERLNLPTDVSAQEKSRVGGHFLANAEATCDFTSRFEACCLNYCEVDLNALLYEYETYLKEVSDKLNWGDADLWTSRAKQRLALMNNYFWNENQGVFLDYDFVNSKHSTVPALTGFNTLSTGVASQEQASRMVANLPLFERDYGIAYAPDHEGCRDFQWDYPNVWPPMVYMTVVGLLRYGFTQDAKRIAQKYVYTTVRLFEKTGQLWEKTNAETGNIAGGEYDAAPMLGWSAGVFLAMVDLLK